MTRSNCSEQPRLYGQLNTGSIVFMVIAAAAPLTVIGGNAPIAIASGNGAGAPVGFLIASTVMLLFSIGFMALTPHVKEAGAFFSYVSLGLGKRLGTGTAYIALIAYTAMQAAMYGYMGWAVNDFVTNKGGAEVHWAIYALITAALIAYLGYRHIELSSKVLGIALVLELLVVLIMNFFIMDSGGSAGISLASFDPGTAFSSGLGIAILFALTGFIGFEATAVFRDEAKNPAKTIPRATYLAVAIIGVFYTFSVWALVVAHGSDMVAATAQRTLDGEANLLLDTAEAFGGGLLREVMQVLLLTSIFACVLSFHNVLARYQFNLGCRGTLSKKLTHVHPEHQSPSTASLVQTFTAVIIIVLCVALNLDPLTQVFGYMAGIATVGMIGMMLLTTLATLFFFKNNLKLAQGKTWQTRVAPSLTTLMLVGCLWLVLSNFTMITGGSVQVSAVIALIPLVAFIIGVLFGRSDSLASQTDPVTS